MNISRPGAIDLSALAQPKPTDSGASAGAVFSVDVTSANFEQIVQSSMRHIVVLGLWSPRSPESADFTRVLVDATSRFGGAIQIATVNVDDEPQVAQALGIQGVPVTVGLVQGRPVPLFQGVVAAEEVERYLAELHQLGVQNGLTGRAEPRAAEPTEVAEEPEEVDDPRFATADEAWANGDFDTAIAEYTTLAAQHPGEVEIAERLAGVKLMARVNGADLTEARRAAGDRPDDIDAQLLVADLDVTGGHVDDAFARLIDLIRRTSDDDRTRVREHLLELFNVVGPTDPRVATARRALATALF